MIISFCQCYVIFNASTGLIIKIMIDLHLIECLYFEDLGYGLY